MSALDEDTAYRYWQAGRVRPILTIVAQRIKQFDDVTALGELITKEQLRLVELHDNIDKLGKLLIVHPKIPSEVYDTWRTSSKTSQQMQTSQKNKKR